MPWHCWALCRTRCNWHSFAKPRRVACMYAWMRILPDATRPAVWLPSCARRECTPDAWNCRTDTIPTVSSWQAPRLPISNIVWSGREDIPRADQCLPRPLHPPDDAALLAELRRRNDLLSNALLLMRLPGMRIGECVDLAPDCLRHLGEEHWAVQVPLGKLHTERWVPVDQEARQVLAGLAFLRTLPPSAENFLLPRPRSRAVLCGDLRAALREAAAAAGIAAKIVPHQLRHTYATSMLRAGVSLPALMKLLGHRTANMTLRYVEITQQDLQREFLLAREKPRHLIPIPPALSGSRSAIRGCRVGCRSAERRHARAGLIPAAEPRPGQTFQSADTASAQGSIHVSKIGSRAPKTKISTDWPDM